MYQTKIVVLEVSLTYNTTLIQPHSFGVTLTTTHFLRSSKVVLFAYQVPYLPVAVLAQNMGAESYGLHVTIRTTLLDGTLD